jgi:hypothetical protein
LSDLLRRELSTVPVRQWGYFFPVHLAVWRFIEAERPGVIGDLKAGYDREPYFEGTGSEWFCGTLGNNEQYLDLLERLMYPIANQLTATAKARGHLLQSEVPQIDPESVNRLADLVLLEVDAALASGELRQS